jgi:hypothetical protein
MKRISLRYKLAKKHNQEGAGLLVSLQNSTAKDAKESAGPENQEVWHRFHAAALWPL